MREEDYTIFEYRMSKEIKYAGLIHNEKMSSIFEKACIKTKTAGYVSVSIYHPLSWDGKQILKPVFNFHGGGNVLGYCRQDGKYCRLLANLTGCAIFNIDYVVVPEFEYPKPLFSNYGAIAEMRKRCDKVGIDKGHVVAVGHSVGGYISACLTLIDRDREELGIKEAILDHPPLRQEICAGFRKAKDPSKAVFENRVLQYINRYYNSSDEPNDELAFPLFADLHSLSETLILSAEYDSLKNEEEVYADEMQKARGDVTYAEFANYRHGLTHEWLDELMPEEPKKVWDMITAFVRGIM